MVHGCLQNEKSKKVKPWPCFFIRSINKNAIPLQCWYEQVRKKRGCKRVRVALIRKVCEVISAMLRTDSDYDPLLLSKNSQPAR